MNGPQGKKYRLLARRLPPWRSVTTRPGGRRPTPGPPPFSPADVAGLVGWYRAGPTWCFTDAGGTVPAGDGDAVRVWVDQAGTANAAQATLASRPVLRLTGGRWWLDFDGTDDLLTAATPRVDDHEVWAVAACDFASTDTPRGERVVFGLEQASGAERRWAAGLHCGNNAVQNTTHNTPGAFSAPITSVGIAAGATVMYRARTWKADAATTNLSTRTATKGPVTNSTADTLPAGSGGFSVGYGNGASPFYFAGLIGELVRLNTPASTEDAAALQAYLEAAWGTLV